jgi:membrane protein DedA with SNARE-associated domain
VDQLALRLIELISQENSPLGLSILALSALVEYVFPPFPGDTITLFGAFLITAKGWSFAAVFGAVLLGSSAGAMADFWLGRVLQRRNVGGERLARLVARFQRHGEVVLVINRFLPGVRALFFVAAGMAGMRWSRVLLWATVSATLWNLLLIAVGSVVGANFEALQRFFMTYARLVWAALGVLLLVWLARAIVRRIRRKPS